MEKNVCRWLMFSNHYDAIPFDDMDRRCRVVENPTERKDPDYYTKLYALIDDSGLSTLTAQTNCIASVEQQLMPKFEITQADIDAAMQLHLIGAGPTCCEINQVLEALIIVGTKRYAGQLIDAGLTRDQINEKLGELDFATWQQNALATIMEKVNARRQHKLN